MCKKVQLLCSFNTLSDYAKSQTLTKSNDSFGNGGIVGIKKNVTHEGLVNFQLIQR